jgi:pyridoxine kinase
MQHILSIQSWVTFGHVGNAAAIFPLQRLGFEVWGLHTVQFSNHTGYQSWKGMVFPAQHLAEVIEGLQERSVLSQCSAVLSGYMGSSSTAEIILDAVQRVRQVNPQALYCCDPVMGDTDRKLFVHPDIPNLIKSQVLGQADILSPNLFELEILTEQTIKTRQDALGAAQRLRSKMHQGGPRILLVTSLLCQDTPEGFIETLVLGEESWLVRTPLIPLEPPRNGTGDVIAALFLGHYLKTGNLSLSLEKAVSALYGVLQLTHQHNSREIQLIAAQDQLIQPSLTFEAEPVA